MPPWGASACGGLRYPRASEVDGGLLLRVVAVRHARMDKMAWDEQENTRLRVLPP